MIQLENLVKSYGKQVVVDHLNADIPSGAITGFIGPNGAGKTTTINMICTILPPDEGTVLLNGTPAKPNDSALKKSFFLVPDSPDLFLRLSAREFINFMADLYEVDKASRNERLARYSEEFEMNPVLDEQMKSYSHGMRQKAIILAALVCSPDIWILDEPLTGLDPKASYLLKEKMKAHAASGKTVLFSTHMLEVAEKLCDKILIIDQGKLIYDGSLEALQQRYPKLSLEQIFLQLTGFDVSGTSV